MGLCATWVQALKGRLAYAVADARAFSAQQTADAERTKRSYSQVGATKPQTLDTLKRLAM